MSMKSATAASSLDVCTGNTRISIWRSLIEMRSIDQSFEIGCAPYRPEKDATPRQHERAEHDRADDVRFGLRHAAAREQRAERDSNRGGDRERNDQEQAKRMHPASL